MRPIYHQNKFFFGGRTKGAYAKACDINRSPSALEEAEARAATGDPIEQLELIQENRRRRGQIAR